MPWPGVELWNKGRGFVEPRLDMGPDVEPTPWNRTVDIAPDVGLL
jgi:hypothetical protein